MGKDPVLYDPVEIQIREINALAENEKMTIAGLVGNTDAIRLLLRQLSTQLVEVKNCKRLLWEKENELSNFRNEKENLRVSLASIKEQGKISLLDIPVGILTGFAINMLTTDYKDLVGWLLLVLGLFLLIFLKVSSLPNSKRKQKNKTEDQS